MARSTVARAILSHVSGHFFNGSRSLRGVTRRRVLESLERRELMAALISEVNPTGSSSSYGADWFEVTNTGTSALDITGWKIDDSSNALANAAALRGVTSIPAGKSAVFLEGLANASTDATLISSFSTAWFGSAVPPADVLIGTYGGSGLGLSSGGDAVNLFDANGASVTGVAFGAATTGVTFDNTAGVASLSTLSAIGTNGAFLSANGAETGSPGKRLNASQLSDVDLSLYVRVGRYDLPEPTRTAAPMGSLLAQEGSAVTYDWDTDSLFVVGDGGTSIVQVTKTGELIDSMTLASGSSPQGTEFYDTEGLTYVGNGKFVMVEERDRQLVLFTYVPNTTLTRADTQVVDLGTFAPNIGIEGVSYDPQTNGFIAVKETQPGGIFQTDVDFDLGTATNGSPTTENSINLFDPSLANLQDFADVFALSNLTTLSGPVASHLLVLSQESGKIVKIDRSGNISSSLTIVSDPGNPLTVAAQQHEGLTMDGNGILYVVSENGGGDFDHPQLWVYAPSTVPNQAPTAVQLDNVVTSIPENTSTTSPIKVADIVVTDDGLGKNNLTVTGTDAAFFEITGTALYIKAGTVLDYETQTSYEVSVNVDDPTLGGTPDASTSYTLMVTDVLIENPNVPTLIISEVAPWSSGNSPVGGDWFEVTNTGTTAVDITGWKMDDGSSSFTAAVALNGITSIAPGESVIFIETADLPGTAAVFVSTWFGGTAPAGLQIGSYSGSGVGLSTGGDGVSLYSSTGVLQANVTFAASPAGPFATFNNAAGLNGVAISQLSTPGINGAFNAVNDSAEIGSPGTVGKLFISEVAPWSSGSSPVGGDWFELTNTTAQTIDITGWKMDDSSGSPVAAVALSGITSIAPGESVIFIETSDLVGTSATFASTWFGGTAPAGLQFGSYTGSGVGLSTGGDSVNIYKGNGLLQASVTFGASPSGPFATFDNAVGLNNSAISQLSEVGVTGGFVAANAADEIGSPGTLGRLYISEVAPWSSGSSPIGADWFEVTNSSAYPVNIAGWKMDDGSASLGSAVELSGITSIAPGESVIFIETDSLANTAAQFLSTWYGAYPPTGLQLGSYSGSGVGLSTGGDGVNLFDSSGMLQASVTFGASPAGPFSTFNNAVGLSSGVISQLSSIGIGGAFVALNDANEIGSPGTTININRAPTAVVLSNQLHALPENTNTASRIKVADIAITDEALGENALSLSGADANAFEIDGDALYLKAGNIVSFEVKSSYSVTVNVDDVTVGGTPDAFADFTLSVVDGNNSQPVVFVGNDPLHPGSFSLFVIGTDRNDHIEVEGERSGRVEVEIESRGVHFERTFTGPFARIVVYGLAGDDEIELDDIRTQAWIFGGDGDDELKGGAGSNLLLGGAGSDRIEARGGRDLVIGGSGADRLQGGRGEDILIAGTTDYDTNDVALAAILDQWTLPEVDYLTRIANLKDSSFAYSLDGTMVHDDGDSDKLQGGQGLDWYFAHTIGNKRDKDKVDGAKRGEVITAI